MADTGWKSPGTVVNDNSVGTVAWEDPSYAKANDDNYAFSAGSGVITQYLKATNFGFNIPSGATITGIEMSFKRGVFLENTYDEYIKIVKSDGSIGATNKALTSTDWLTESTYQSYGGSNDLWGETWTPTDINDVDFGVAISADIYYDEYGITFIDHIQIKVYYTSGTIANAGVSSSTTSSPSPSILGKASTSQSSDAVLLSNPGVSTAIGVNVSANSDEISLTSLSPSLSAGVNLGVSVQESVLSSTAVLASGKAITSPSTDEVLFTSLSPSLIAGVNVSANSDEISLTSLNPSLNVSADISVDEVSYCFPIS